MLTLKALIRSPGRALVSEAQSLVCVLPVVASPGLREVRCDADDVWGKGQDDEDPYEMERRDDSDPFLKDLRG